MSEMSLNGVLKQNIVQTIKGMKMADRQDGTVISVNPLSVRISVDMPPIPAVALALTDAVKPKSFVFEGQTITIDPGLQVGDKVLMLRVSGGNFYIILSRL